MMITERMVEISAKAMERYRMKDFDWTDDQFEIWWNNDDRCDKESSLSLAKIGLEAIFKINVC